MAYFLLMGWLTPTRYLPLVSSAVGAFATFRMLPVVISSLVKPFGVPFRVTPKGSGNEESEFDAYTFFSIAFWIAVTALGLVVNVVPEWSRIGEGEFSVVSAYWAVVNIAVLMVASLICFERPRPLLDSFATDEEARIAYGPATLPGRVTSLSLEGGTVEIEAEPALAAGDTMIVAMPDFPEVRCTVDTVSRLGPTRVAIRFSYTLEGECRDRMIVKLYTGGYSQDIRALDRSAIAGGLWSRMFGRTARAAP